MHLAVFEHVEVEVKSEGEGESEGEGDLFFVFFVFCFCLEGGWGRDSVGVVNFSPWKRAFLSLGA